MVRSNGRRIWAMILVICLMLGMIPTFVSHTQVEAEAVSGIDSLTCSSFISNVEHRNYIDGMMHYYLNTYSSLRTTLDNGKSVIFMFEGGSDNYPSNTYEDSDYDTRTQAVVIVVQEDSSGNAKIVFYCEDCSSIPDDPDDCTGAAYSGATTIADGIYGFQTTNHTGPYGALNTYASQGYYTPPSNQNGYFNGCSGINIHTRTSAGSGGGWSLGCQVIGYGNSSSNAFNNFMKAVAGITYNVWVTYKSALYTITAGIDKGYYVLDRQLSLENASGVKYGSGSLIEMYNEYALGNLTDWSTTARANAGVDDYASSQCTFYPAHCEIEVTLDGAPINSQPCSVSTTAKSETLENAVAGTKYTATGLYQNAYGNYWYRITTSSGETGHIYGGEVKYLNDVISDITLTGASTPDSHVQGSTFYVDGTIASKYNQLTSVACYIYDGFGEKGEAVTGTSDTPSGTSYVLKGSNVDDATWMGTLPLGNYTYSIYASYINYYATDATTLMSNTGTLTLKDDFFVVIPSAVDTATCNHTNTTHVLQESTCLQDGSSVTACSTCGLVTRSVTTGGHAYGDWSTTTAPTCTATGVSSRTCSRCGGVETKTIPANGHDYSTVTHPATCLEYERIEYTCSVCGHNYSVYADELMTQWVETKPEGIDESLIESKTQYRYSDYETITSGSAAVDGYTQVSKEWIKSASSYTHYVSEWPVGFETSHTLYSQYNKDPSIVDSETETSKLVINSSGTLVGHVFYHWCYGTYTEGPINRTTSQTNDGSHTTFHAFVASIDTVDPSTLTTASDTSVTYPHAAACTDSHWWYAIPVYEDTYTTYTAEYTHERWTAWSDWSDDAVTSSDTRKVETRTVYRYVDAQLGDHNWSAGVCTVCGTACEHSYASGFCTICAEAEPIKDFYLFGYINGANYACEEDYQNLGEYKFVDGQLVVAFDQPCYVGVKTADNNKWFMTEGYLGENVTSAVLYDSNTLTNPDKLYVPKGHEITFTLVVNDDGSVTLSYVVSICTHNWVYGTCTICDEVCPHGEWADGLCTVCGMPCSDHVYSNNVCTICGITKPVKDYYLFGFINDADYACEADYENLGEYKFVGGKLTATFQTDSYVGIKSGDNADWYMTNGWLGTEVSAATLYNTNTGANEKLFVPGGVEVTFTLIDNGNDTYLLTYVVTEVTVVQPTLKLNYGTVSFESEIMYNIYFNASNLDDVVEMGMITFDSQLTDGTIADAVKVYSDYSTDGTLYMVATEGISAKYIGDQM
ncbi:MAG: hypothetical protein IJW45_08555, partial [Oscillospiraceae bacterium]|nr:hypothetical protein [Oscillospiraceae bacterium]